MHAAYHAHAVRHTSHRNPNPFRRFVDSAVYAVGLLGVVVNVPQLLQIWIGRNADGVSIVSWCGFLSLSVFWFVYGYLHNERPIMLANGLLIIVHAMIVASIIVIVGPQ